VVCRSNGWRACKPRKRANEGKLGTAWVEYRLQKEATFGEVVLKLNNFRSRSYSLSITVDGQEVFNGATPASLGYCTLSCMPYKASKVRIQLMGAAFNNSGNNGVEFIGKRLDDGGKRSDANAKGALRIIKVELYEPVR
jgi:beta-galactosidase